MDRKRDGTYTLQTYADMIRQLLLYEWKFGQVHRLVVELSCRARGSVVAL